MPLQATPQQAEWVSSEHCSKSKRDGCCKVLATLQPVNLEVAASALRELAEAVDGSTLTLMHDL